MLASARVVFAGEEMALPGFVGRPGLETGTLGLSNRGPWRSTEVARDRPETQWLQEFPLHRRVVAVHRGPRPLWLPISLVSDGPSDPFRSAVRTPRAATRRVTRYGYAMAAPPCSAKSDSDRG